MSVKERIRIVRIIEKIEKNKAYSDRIGIRITSVKKIGSSEKKTIDAEE